MRRFFLDIVLAAAICIGLFFLLRLFASTTGLFKSQQAKYVYQILQSIIVVFGISGITYKRLWNAATLKSKSKTAIFLFLQFGVFVIAYNFLSVNKKAFEYYTYFMKENFKSWQGKTYEKDDTLGYRMIPNIQSSLVYNYLPTVPVRTEKNGFRIPDSIQALTNADQPVDLLFLGCSFTFGSACVAENTFPYLVAAEKRMNYLNAGVGGYGLAQMVLQAQQLIARYRPRYVVVQNSPWLIARGVSEFAPSRGGYLFPTPYFSDHGSSFQIETPIYHSRFETLFPAEDRKAFSGKFWKYYFLKGFPYFFGEQTQMLLARGRNMLQVKKWPTKKLTEAEQFAYSTIFQTAERYGTKVILLNLSNPPGSDNCRKLAGMSSNVFIANADSVLYRLVGSTSGQQYKRKFSHWAKRGNDSVLVDSHPNQLSHQLIAKSILMHIEE